MKGTITATQKIEYRIPAPPATIMTTNSHQVPLEQLSEDAIGDYFDAMKENALEYRRSKIEVKVPAPAAAGKKLADKIG